jgi:APA family basic amino acid/polyamine antiporter
MDNNKEGFKKLLGPWDSIAIIIAIVIGVGIFRVPSEVAGYLKYPHLMLVAWLAGGIISALGSLCYAELSACFPRTGGNYVYLNESYGSWAGFLFGWTELLAVRTGSIAAVSFIFAEYLGSLLSLDRSLIKPCAIASIVVLSIINSLGLKHGKRAQDLFTIPKLLALVGIIVFGIMLKRGNMLNFSYVPAHADRYLFSSFGLALIPILWTYGGWHENTFMAGETHNAKKVLPVALLTGISVITALYVAINFIYLYYVPAKEIANATLIAADVLQILVGRGARKILEAFIVLSSLGCINAMIMTGSRVTYAMAKDNAIFKYIGQTNRRYGTPTRAITINAIWSIALIIFGTFNMLLFFTGVLVWAFFALVVGGLFILRYRQPNIERPYKVWGYPFVPAVFIMACIGLVINTIIFYPSQSLIGLGILVSGIPLFFISQRRKTNA